VITARAQAAPTVLHLTVADVNAVRDLFTEAVHANCRLDHDLKRNYRGRG